MKNYLKFEKRLIKLFKEAREFVYGGVRYSVVIAEKPRPSKGTGECKTDIYLKAKGEGGDKEFKISVKMKESHEWFESKITKTRAEQLFGRDWERLITKSVEELRYSCENRALWYLKAKGRARAHSITMGWRLEVTSKPRTLSANLPLTSDEVKNSIYKGCNLPQEKRNAIVGEEVIIDSGIATHLLCIKNSKDLTIDDVVSAMIDIDLLDIPPMYLTLFAINYRYKEGKIDGSRQLAIYNSFEYKEGKMEVKMEFGSPLKEKGFDVLKKFQEQLDIAGIKHLCDLNNNVHLMDKPCIYC